MMSFRMLVAEVETGLVDLHRWAEDLFFGEHLKYRIKFGNWYGKDLF